MHVAETPLAQLFNRPLGGAPELRRVCQPRAEAIGEVEREIRDSGFWFPTIESELGSLDSVQCGQINGFPLRSILTMYE